MADEKMNREDLQRRFSALVGRQQGRLEAVCRQFFPWDEHHQRELMQHILLHLWNYLQDHADEDERQWERWCPNAARQVACNYLKTHEYTGGLRLVPLEESQREALPALDNEDTEELERTERVLSELSADDYRIVELYTKGIPHAEMARQLGISLRKLQYRIREVKLRIKKISMNHKSM